jgi:hypothetical protein
VARRRRAAPQGKRGGQQPEEPRRSVRRVMAARRRTLVQPGGEQLHGLRENGSEARRRASLVGASRRPRSTRNAAGPQDEAWANAPSGPGDQAAADVEGGVAHRGRNRRPGPRAIPARPRLGRAAACRGEPRRGPGSRRLRHRRERQRARARRRRAGQGLCPAPSSPGVEVHEPSGGGCRGGCIDPPDDPYRRRPRTSSPALGIPAAAAHAGRPSRAGRWSPAAS